jgi:iron complex outermembrane receptor protein
LTNRTKQFRAHALASAAATVLCALAAPAQAQDQTGASNVALEEIVVTAQRRQERLQDVPIAIAAVTAEMLASSGIDTTNALSQAVPAVQFGRSGPSGLFFVRGVGTTNASGGEEGSNAFYVDGVYVPDLAGTITNFNNVDRVEVLKGPQGTLFGRNAFGGLVHVITREPGDSLVVRGEATYGNYQTVSGKFYAGGPLAEGLSADIALTGSDQGAGWGRNVTLNREIRQEDYWGARSKVVWQPADTIKLTLAGDYYTFDDDTALSWSLDEDFLAPGGIRSAGSMNSRGDVPSATSIEIWGASFTGEVDLDFATFTSISAIRDTENHSNFDVDATQLPLLKIDYISGTRAYQQEFRLASADTDPLSWQIGAFYLNSKQSNYSFILGSAASARAPFPAANPNSGTLTDGSLVTNSYAAFGELSWKITPRTTLTGGLRFTRDERELESILHLVFAGAVQPNPSRPTGNLSYSKLTWRAALRHEFSDDFNVYASYNRGFKAGTYSLQSVTLPPVQPMFIDAYEIGFKSELFDRRLRLNGAVFHYDISDYQVRSASAGSPGSAVLLNAASVKVDGIDVDFEAAPSEGLRIFGGFTWLDSRFSKFGGPGTVFQAPILYPSPATCTANGTKNPGTLGAGARTGGLVTCFGDVSGNQTPLAPDFTASLGFSYAIPVNDQGGEVQLAALGNYNSGYPFESDNVLRQPEFFTLNASLTYRVTENWGVKIWGKNLTDAKTFDQKISNGIDVTTARADPLTYGVTVNFDF